MRRALWTGVAFLAGLGLGAGVFAAKAAGPARKYINLPGRAIAAPFSDAVLVGDTLYLAGRIGFKPGTRQVPDTPEEEAKLVLDDYKKVLAEAGMTMDDLVSVTVYCSDVKLFDQWNKVYPTYFGKDLPARAFIGSGSLLFGARFEMTAIAVRK
jgi:2-iminobutanoate/2-iminopropanoate deaminase